uniref:Glutamate/phenylalanine/leucine/valine/L-tryptophan dehydrogenase C-terminal domain-containing protein n=1 Tax=Odontella aurita TaxID=265563 RepID=A0A7S4JNP8_9STRA|mmetsp:Transcript_50607/g.152485  ORF Transcript_50607/g.152485 Transcript_50607/m.152485 type:complete len:511 (+) Transcript_50607:52-1584(+)
MLSATSKIALLPPASLAARARAAVAPSVAASLSSRPLSSSAGAKKSLVTGEEGVHQTMQVSKAWRNKPLFRRQGDVRFKTGLEAANLLVAEAKRRDAHEVTFIDSVRSTMQCLSPIFDRNPRYAFVAKQLMEAERYIQFRVAWIDDTGVVRMNRGYRIQYSSSIGPYEGAIHFGHHVNSSIVKSLGFDAVFSNALTGFDVGAAVGGSDINPFDKSEAEIQRFCQSYMTELAKYIGPDIDQPTMGMGVSEKEIGYLFGQYKRINVKSSSGGKPFLSAMDTSAPGYGVAHFANEMLQDRGDSLEGKRVLIIGSGKVARSVAEKLLSFGAIPLTFSDASGHVYEPDGIDGGKLATINKIKNERGALLGRYIIASTTAQFNDPGSVLDIPCDLCIPCASMGDIDEAAVNKLADNGCVGVIEGGHGAVTPEARKVLKKRGLMYGPDKLTLTGPSIAYALGHKNATDERLAAEVARIYKDVKITAQEFNARGDLFAGANIAGFLRVANVMLNHGAV